MATLDEIRETFFTECEEQLEALADGLAELGSGEAGSETVNSMFRAVHSIKGGAASFNLDALAQFSHSFEFLLDDLRSGRTEISPALLRHMYKATDHLSALVGSRGSGQGLSEDLLHAMVSEIASLATGGFALNGAETDTPGFAPIALDLNLTDACSYQIIFRPTPALYASGNDPVHLFREIGKLGSLQVKAVWHSDDVEELLEWQLELETSADREKLLEVFEFVDDLAQITILEVDRKIEPTDSELAHQSMDAGTKASPVAADRIPASLAGKPAVPKATLRVDLALVDALINLVGELVINQSVLTQALQGGDVGLDAKVSESLEDLRNLTRQIQENVMTLRAESVKPLFQRMARIVREAAELSGKEVSFQMFGDTTEVDRTVVERHVDPLTHILRNSIDHGIETAEVREECGKSSSGLITLSAQHRSGRVLIEVSDDGGGIDRGKVLSKAVEKGLVGHGASLTPQEIDRLLFLPGFSTADEVTKLSGRGVGMDVVNKEIQKLGGRIALASEPGKGTTLTISLPLTLAVLDGMVVDVAGQTMVIPISAVIETIRPQKGQIQRVGSITQMICVRETLVPVIDLAVAFRYSRRNIPPSDTQVVLMIETAEGEQRALVVDQIVDQRQVVIKSLEINYGQVAGVSAATILGDGKIALIIDPDGLAHLDHVHENISVSEMSEMSA